MPRMAVIYARVPADLRDEAVARAVECRVSLTAFVERALEAYLTERFSYDGPVRSTLP